MRDSFLYIKKYSSQGTHFKHTSEHHVLNNVATFDTFEHLTYEKWV